VDWIRVWDGEEILQGSWELCKTKQWKMFRYWFWNDIIAPMVCCDNYVVKCTYCGWKGPKTQHTYFCLDHIVPYVKAPELAFELSNITIACNHCNKRKGNKTLEEFLNEDCATQE